LALSGDFRSDNRNDAGTTENPRSTLRLRSGLNGAPGRMKRSSVLIRESAGDFFAAVLKSDYNFSRAERKSKLRSLLSILVLLVLGLSFAVTAEDVPETAYDELEPSPYEGTPVFRVVLSQAIAPARRIARIIVRLQPRDPFRFSVTRIPDREARRLSNERLVLALLCILLF